MTRRTFVGSTAAAGLGLGAAGIWALRQRQAGVAAYDAAVRRTWRGTERAAATERDLQRELVRYATLAPSSHNTQCWKFLLAAGTISIRPDYQRRCPVVDPDDHHLFVSLGCATENLVQAAAAFGRQAEVRIDPESDTPVVVTLTPAPATRSTLFEAIPRRQSTRGEFDGRPLPTSEMRLLEVAGARGDVRVHLIADQPGMATVLDYVIEGNSRQMGDPAFRRELREWIRFNGVQAAEAGDGVFAGSSGNPSVPAWLGRRLFDTFFTVDKENDRYRRHVRSSAGIAVFVSSTSDKAHWIEVGRAYQRFALQAAALGVHTAHLNQPVEVAALRPAFAKSLGITTGRPDLVIRFGRGPVRPRSLRRPVDAVLV